MKFGVWYAQLEEHKAKEEKNTKGENEGQIGQVKGDKG